MNMSLMDKKDYLYNCLKQYSSMAVAFSGGVDSTLLLAAAYQVLGNGVIAMTAQSPTHPAEELEMAVSMARKLGVRHILFQTDEMADPHFAANGPDRCYHCKKAIFSIMRLEADKEGIQILAHGVNVDDFSDFRPGLKAAKENSVAAPLSDAGLTKADIRQLAKGMGLANWDRPAMACLATRIPYGTVIQPEALDRIQRAETIVRRFGVAHCRVRHHGHLACIEVDAASMEGLIDPNRRQQIVSELRDMGYLHVCLDLEGYVTGKMNRELDTSSF